MSNMSYCRFRNTLGDLDDCKDALEAMMYEGEAALDAEELVAAKNLVKTCAEILMTVAEASGIDSDTILDAALDTESVAKALEALNEGSKARAAREEA